MTELILVEQHGPWPFITYRVFRTPDGGLRHWRSRPHRKGLSQQRTSVEFDTANIARYGWSPRELNWWIGTVFAVGASLFALASVLSLCPSLTAKLSLNAGQVNAVYFAGSIPFTTAAYLQLFQAANVGANRKRRRWFGWRPGDIGWLSCALQFAGTLLFNLNTFDAMNPSPNWWIQDLAVWLPNIAGSTLFLLSGYLAFVETCHRHFAWRPRDISWWVVFMNLLGCLGFMVAALLSPVTSDGPSDALTFTATAFTLQGALCFLVGSLLMLPEMTMASDD